MAEPQNRKPVQTPASCFSALYSGTVQHRQNILPEYLALLSYPSLFPGRLIIPVLLLIHSLVRRFQEGIQI